MSHSPGGRESPSSTASSTTASGSGSVILSVGSGSNGCRNSGASFDSGRATSTTFQGVRYSAGLSSESSLGSFRNSYHSSNSSLGSIPSEEIRNFDVSAMISQGVADHEILNAWLTGIHLECYYQNFIQAGYDMHTISRMTPEDLNAVGVTKPHHRKKIKSEISQLNISEGLPDYIPESVEEWLRILKMEDYLGKLKEQGYTNVRQVTNITWEDLEDIGILKLGHQKKFMLAIKRIQDILCGKRVQMSSSTNIYGQLADNYSLSSSQLSAQQLFRNTAPSMPYIHQGSLPMSPAMNSHQHQQQQQQHMMHQYHSAAEQHYQQRNQHQEWSQVPKSAISHNIQVHHPPKDRLSSNVQQMMQPLYHPEVISIRVNNGHPKPLDSPPEDEPIYGTSSFNPKPPPGGVNSPSSWQQKQKGSPKDKGTFKSFEEGETAGCATNCQTTTTNGVNFGSNLSITKQSMSNTWTLPRLQKHKPISKVMGGGTPPSFGDCKVTYPINPGPFAPQMNQIDGPVPSVTTFGKVSDYASPRSGPPPPPRRSSCSALGHTEQFDEDNLPLPPPPIPENFSSGFRAELEPNVESLQQDIPGHPSSKSILAYAHESYKSTDRMTASYYGQRIALATNNVSSSYHANPGSTTLMNGTGNILNYRSTLPSKSSKSRDPSPGSEPSTDLDLSANSALFSRGVKRNGSDASFKSNSSTESESIPFANDNAGTIKQQKPTNRTSQQGDVATNGGGELSQQSQQVGEAGDVLSDIGSMLADLTDQLDAILEQEKFSKR